MSSLSGNNAKCTDVVATKGENINICWSPNGSTIAVGNKVRKTSVDKILKI